MRPVARPGGDRTLRGDRRRVVAAFQRQISCARRPGCHTGRRAPTPAVSRGRVSFRIARAPMVRLGGVPAGTLDSSRIRDDILACGYGRCAALALQKSFFLVSRRLYEAFLADFSNRIAVVVVLA